MNLPSAGEARDGVIKPRLGPTGDDSILFQILYLLSSHKLLK